MGSKGKTARHGQSDWQAMLDQFDAALVAVPHSLHAPIGLGLIAAGKHVFMEKPLATTAADCERMAEAAAAKGVVLSVGLLRRYLRIARWTKALIESGTLGEIKSFDVARRLRVQLGHEHRRDPAARASPAVACSWTPARTRWIS